jgi:hypothetical protein
MILFFQVAISLPAAGNFLGCRNSQTVPVKANMKNETKNKSLPTQKSGKQ